MWNDDSVGLLVVIICNYGVCFSLVIGFSSIRWIRLSVKFFFSEVVIVCSVLLVLDCFISVKVSWCVCMVRCLLICVLVVRLVS